MILSDNYYFYDRDVNYFGFVKNGHLLEYKQLGVNHIGKIYRARIKSYSKLLCAFILDLGLEKDGLLRKKETVEDLKVGDTCLVEIRQYPKNNKMIELTQKLSLTDGYLVYLPYSKKNNNFINRTKARFLDDKIREQKKDLLIKKYEEIYRKKNLLPVPKLVYQPNEFLRLISNDDIAFVSNCKLEIPFKYIYDKEFSVKYNKYLSKQIVRLNEKTISLDSGGNLVIDKLEALTFIDVNSALKGVTLNKEQVSYEINKQACESIAINLSLREIRKMVVIDFINLKNLEERNNIEKYFIEMLKTYGIRYKIYGFTKMGLFELVVQ